MASKKGGTAAPPPPDPAATAQAQTSSNVNTAVANSILGNANEITPYGSVTYKQIGSQHIGGQPDGSGGYIGGGTPGQVARSATGALLGRGGAQYGDPGYDIPQFERTVSLSPTEQTKFDQQQKLGIGLNDLALGQTSRLTDVLGRPINTEGLPDRVNSLGNLPSLQDYNLARVGDAGDIQRSIGPTDFSADRTKVEDALYARLNPQLSRDRDALENKLVNQGFQRGTTAFNEAADEFNRQANDARLGVVRAGGDEQSRLFGLALGQGQFANTAQQQAYDQMVGSAGFNNAAQQSEVDRANQNRLGLYGLGAQAADFQNQQREAGLQEQLALRNQPINEVGALMGGGQVNLPNFANYRGGEVAATPVGQYAYQSADLANQQYQADLNRKMQERSAIYGAIGGAAGAGLYGLGKKFG
jgi:hypothetical protein